MYSVYQAIVKRLCDQIEIRDGAHSSEGEHQFDQCYKYIQMCKISSGNFSSLANGFKFFWQASWNVSSLANVQKKWHEKFWQINEHKYQKNISNKAATTLIQGACVW